MMSGTQDGKLVGNGVSNDALIYENMNKCGTNTTGTGGTPAFMSPEVHRGEEALATASDM